MSAAVTVPPGVELCHLPAAFRLARGGELAGAALAFERQGPAGAPTIVALGGISAGRHASAHASAEQRGWWEGMVGPGAPLDTARFQVVSFDWLGGVGASTAPAADEPFPFVDARDQAAALWHLCGVLRVERLHALVGCSYGGMVGLQAAALAPQRVEHLAVIGAAHRSQPQASAWRSVQRRIVELGVLTKTVPQALALARGLALLTYRTPGELAARFLAAPSWRGDDIHFPVQDWLTARGADFAARWTAEQFLCLNRSLDAHCIDPAQVAVPTSLLAFRGDQLVPPEDVRELAAGLPCLRAHRELPSVFGHDAFLKEPIAVGAFLREVLS